MSACNEEEGGGRESARAREKERERESEREAAEEKACESACGDLYRERLPIRFSALPDFDSLLLRFDAFKKNGYPTGDRSVVNVRYGSGISNRSRTRSGIIEAFKLDRTIFTFVELGFTLLLFLFPPLAADTGGVDLGFGFEEDEGVVDVADAGTSADDDVTPAEVLLTLPVLAASLSPCSNPAAAAAAAAFGTWTRKAALTGLWSDVTNSGHAFRRERVTS